MVTALAPYRQGRKPLVLGLYSSVPASGKSSFARALISDGFVRLPLAQTLKQMGRVVLEALGYDKALIDELESVRKDVPLDALDGVTPRWLYQSLGTDWGRTLIHQELWLRCWLGKAERLLADGVDIVVDDVRFPNEAQMIEEVCGGAMVRIRRPEAEASAGKECLHASEGALDDWDFAAEVLNRGTLEALGDQARQLVRQLEV